MNPTGILVLDALKTHSFEQLVMGVSENGGTPKSSILIGISSINRPFWDTPIFGNTLMNEAHFKAARSNWILDKH